MAIAMQYQILRAAGGFSILFTGRWKCEIAFIRTNVRDTAMLGTQKKPNLMPPRRHCLKFVSADGMRQDFIWHYVW